LFKLFNQSRWSFEANRVGKYDLNSEREFPSPKVMFN